MMGENSSAIMKIMKADVLAGMNGRNQQTEPKKSDISNQYD
jgi:hypothetical protein